MSLSSIAASRMEEQPTEKSRREKRKESRLAKNAAKHQAWLHHQQRQKMKRDGDSNYKSHNQLTCATGLDSKGKEGIQSKTDTERNRTPQESTVSNDVVKFNSTERQESAVKVKKAKKGSKGNSKKIRMPEFGEMKKFDVSLEKHKDVEIERKLAKKLKVKKGKLRGEDDGLNLLFEGISSMVMGEDDVSYLEQSPAKKSKTGAETKNRKKESLAKGKLESVTADDQSDGICEPRENYTPKAALEDLSSNLSETVRHKKRKMSRQSEKDDIGSSISSRGEEFKSSETAAVLKEVPVQSSAIKRDEKYISPHLRSHSGNESQEHTQIGRRIRGLLNRLSESNVESITAEVSTIFHSIARSVSSQIISEEILAACCGGPRGNQQHAAVFAAFVAGMACLVGIDFSAKLIASLAIHFEEEYQKDDNLSLRNITLLLSYLCVFGVCSSDLIYDFIITLSKRLTEVDVSTILTVLQCCGMKIRADNPSAMKDFILSIQNRVNELKASNDRQEMINSKRMNFMLETICEIKNNKKRAKDDPAHHTRIKKWLQKLQMDDKMIRGLKWSKLLEPGKKGQWWLSGDMASMTDNTEEIADRIDKDRVETQRMLQLAAAQRMNTDSRRAIFCIIMSGGDYIDAFEKLLRLDLSGKQDRDIVRVLVECCLQEKVFNKYYTLLASKLCEHDKNHKFTLQFCLWDHFKELESMQLMRSMHLAKLTAEMIASFTLSLAVLKSVELGDIRQLTPKRIMHFRMLFEAIFECSDGLVWNIFTRVAVAPELEPLRRGVVFFVKEYVVKNNRSATSKFKIAKKALDNLEGILM